MKKQKQFLKILTFFILISNLLLAKYTVKNREVFYNDRKVNVENVKEFKILNDKIAVDDKNVYYLGLIAKSADEIIENKKNTEKIKITTKSIEIIPEKSISRDIYGDNRYFLKDGKKIFVVYGQEWLFENKIVGSTSIIEELNDIDYETFEVVSKKFIKDKNKVYMFGIGYLIVEFGYNGPVFHMHKIEDLVPKNFKVINDELEDNMIFIENDGKIYYLNNELEELKNIDKKTFEPLEYRFIKDKNGVYYYEDKNFYKFIKLQNADTNTFETLNNGYAKDKNYVYFYNIYWVDNYPIVVSADRNSFTVFKNRDFYSSYAKDKNNIYCDGKILKEADYETFDVIRDENYSGNVGTVKDKNNEYEKCNIIEKNKK